MHGARNHGSRSVFCPLMSVLLMAAADAAAGDQAAAPAAPTSRSLWRVTRGGKSAYLLGSVHVLTPEGYPQDAVIEQAYAASQAVAFETDLDALSSPELREKMAALGRLPEGETLADVVAPETFARVERKLGECGRDSAVVSRLKPAFCAIRLIMIEFERLGFSSMFGVDRHFWRRAKLDGKSVLSLETPEAHVQLFAGLNSADGEELLVQALESLTDVEMLVGELRAAWLSGQSTTLAEMINASFAGHPRLYELFVSERNKQWVPRIAAWLEAGGEVLVIVGVGHLVGEESLVDLLRARGFAVEQR